MMKKKIKTTIILILVITLIPINANAKTLGQLKKEYSNTEAQLNEKENNVKATDSQIAAAKSRVNSIYGELEAAEKEIQEINKKISELNESIIQKEKEVKDLMKFFQTSEGESTYLEYIFSATTITDFIYRLSVTEQLSSYNNKLVDEMHEMIKKNNQNIADLHKKEDSLKALQKELSEKLVILAAERKNMYEESMTLKEEVQNQKKIVDYYIKAGCTETSDISECAKELLPAGTKFWRPLRKGHVTSEYGSRFHPIYKYWKLHSGIDLSGYDYDVFSISDGRVLVVGRNSSMGNYVCIGHNINGRNYVSTYMHLAYATVSEKQIVSKDTIIGHMGSTGSSTATHLHLSLNTGTRAYDTSKLVNPRDYINFPSYAQPGNIYPNFYNRTEYYR